MKQITTFIIFLYSFTSFSQQLRAIHGRLQSDDLPAIGVDIINLKTEKSTKSNNDGTFMINAKEDDIIVFVSKQYEYKRYIIDKKDLTKDLIIIHLIPIALVLDEVVVQKNELDAVSLGILSKPATTYTPAERKLFTAKSGLIDPLINLLSGRTKMLKRQVAIEKDEMALTKVETIFEDKYYTETLQIPGDYIKSFQYYLIEDTEFRKALNAKNRSMMKFLMTNLATQYLDILKNENQD